MTAQASERRVLDEAGGFGAMTWVMAIMILLTILAAALGLATLHATTALDRQIAGRLTVQIVAGDPARRDAAAARVLAVLRALPVVRRSEPVDRATLAALLRPWLGEDGIDPELPVPAMIDVTLADSDDAIVARVTQAVTDVSAAARVDRHERWMSPVGNAMRMATLLAAGLVAAMAAASAAVVVLAARAGLETHRATIEVMHLLGSTDVQIARLFQRRIGVDAAIGGAIGTLVALALVIAIGMEMAGLGSDLIGGATLGPRDWTILAAVPVAFAGLAMLAARTAVLATLRRTL